jgi:two-component system phosphate regulon response regulator PhoB
MTDNRVNVLIVDDDPSIREMVCFTLGKNGMQVHSAADARDALLQISTRRPDIILMDWMMPGVSGIDLTRRLRREQVTAGVPIIMLTARITENDKVAGLEAGCDDYIIKPFSPRELAARIKAVLRRTSKTDEHGIIRSGQLALDTLSREVTSNNKAIRLAPTEYRLLEFFMSNPGRSFTRSQILDHVWGISIYLEERTVDVHIRRLRKALDGAGQSGRIKTVRGHGYRFAGVD